MTTYEDGLDTLAEHGVEPAILHTRILLPKLGPQRRLQVSRGVIPQRSGPRMAPGIPLPQEQGRYHEARIALTEAICQRLRPVLATKILRILSETEPLPKLTLHGVNRYQLPRAGPVP